MKIIGGDTPVLLNADATVNEIDDQYVVAQATALAAASNRGEEFRAMAGFWAGTASRRKGHFPVLQNARMVT